MRTTAALTINFSAEDANRVDLWVKLEQIKPPDLFTRASLQSVYDMWIRAATGGSGLLMKAKDCPVQFSDGEFLVILGFYAWPSNPDLPYTLSASLGTITGGVVVRAPREFSYFLTGSKSISLPYYMEEAQLTWETPAYDATGAETAPPAIVAQTPLEITLAAEVFGSVRIRGIAVGKQYNSLMTFDKSITEDPDLPPASPYPDNVVIVGVTPEVPRNSVKISNIDNTITATWRDAGETETEQLRLEIPQCVYDILSLCPDMYQATALLCKKLHTLFVSFNACKDDVILNCRLSGPEDDEQDTTMICSEVSGLSGVTVNPWGVLPLS